MNIYNNGNRNGRTWKLAMMGIARIYDQQSDIRVYLEMAYTVPNCYFNSDRDFCPVDRMVHQIRQSRVHPAGSVDIVLLCFALDDSIPWCLPKSFQWIQWRCFETWMTRCPQGPFHYQQPGQIGRTTGRRCRCTVVVPPLHGLPKLCWKLGTSNLAKIYGPIPWVWIFDRYQSISALLFEGQSRSSCCKRFLHAKRQRRWRRRNTARSMPWLHGQHATAESLVSWFFFHPSRRCSHATDMMMAIRMSVGPKPSSCSTCDLLQLTGHTSQYSICGGYIHVCIICKCKCIRIRICKCHIQMSIYVICIYIHIYTVHMYSTFKIYLA